VIAGGVANVAGNGTCWQYSGAAANAGRQINQGSVDTRKGLDRMKMATRC
jgi:hypothetical protein